MILEHEHEWKAATGGRFEGCSKDGCTAGRFSCDWIENRRVKKLPGTIADLCVSVPYLQLENILYGTCGESGHMEVRRKLELLLKTALSEFSRRE